MKLIRVNKKDAISSKVSEVLKAIGKAKYEVFAAKKIMENQENAIKDMSYDEHNIILGRMQTFDHEVKQLMEAEKQFLALLK